MRLRSDAFCWLRRASGDGSCRLVKMAGAPETTAGQRNTTPFFPPSFPGYHTEHFATCHAKPARLSLTSLRRATVSSHASGLSGNGLAWSRLKRSAHALRRPIPGEGMCQFRLRCFLFRHQQGLRASVLRRSAAGIIFGSPRSTNASATNLAQGLKPDRGEGQPGLLGCLKAD